jgi:Lon protease-like protein
VGRIPRTRRGILALVSDESPPVDIPRILADFRGEVRLFPLPGLVLFPDGVAPLKVFEPRYLAMVKEAAEDDLLIAMALLRPGYELDYEGSPPIHPVVCLGRILRTKEQDDGKMDLLLYGIARARVRAELPSSPFRRARVDLIEDRAPPESAVRIAERMQKALSMIPGRQPMLWSLRKMAEQLRGLDSSPGRYADAVANASDLSPDTLYELLAEPDVLRRFEILIQSLRRKGMEGAPPSVASEDPRLN